MLAAGDSRLLTAEGTAQADEICSNQDFQSPTLDST